MTDKVIIWVFGFLTGLVMAAMASRPPRDHDNDWRRSFNHENTAPNSSKERPLKFRRSDNGYSPRPSTTKSDIIPPPRNP
jgi:hypothetical protein